MLFYGIGNIDDVMRLIIYLQSYCNKNVMWLLFQGNVVKVVGFVNKNVMSLS
jgi:hypothetical protein